MRDVEDFWPERSRARPWGGGQPSCCLEDRLWGQGWESQARVESAVEVGLGSGLSVDLGSPRSRRIKRFT